MARSATMKPFRGASTRMVAPCRSCSCARLFCPTTVKGIVRSSCATMRRSRGPGRRSGCIQYFTDYGLAPIGVGASGGRFEAADGTSVVLARRDDPTLPAPMETGTMLRKTIYGVADRETLDAIAVELGRDREVKRLPDG